MGRTPFEGASSTFAISSPGSVARLSSCRVPQLSPVPPPATALVARHRGETPAVGDGRRVRCEGAPPYTQGSVDTCDPRAAAPQSALPPHSTRTVPQWREVAAPAEPAPRTVPYVWCFVDLYQYRRVQSVPCRTRARESTQQLAGKCESVGCSSAPPRTHGRGTIVDRRVGCSSVVAGRCIHRFEGLRRSLLRMAGTGVSTAAPRDASGHGGVQHHVHQVRLDFTHAMRRQRVWIE